MVAAAGNLLLQRDWAKAKEKLYSKLRQKPGAIEHYKYESKQVPAEIMRQSQKICPDNRPKNCEV